MIPWHSLKPNSVDLMFKMIKCSIEALEFHLNRPTNQMDKDLLARMIISAQQYPAFTQGQREQFLNENAIFLKLTPKLLTSD